MKKLLFFTLFFLWHTGAQSADGFSTLEERMSGREFRETGLEKLTDAELNALNDWLRRHSVATLENASARPAGTAAAAVAPAGGQEDMQGFAGQPKGKEEVEVIHSNIVGTFSGWQTKGTLFKLANGMIWQQTENDSFSITPVENPEVIIKKGFMNKWKLSLVGHKSRVTVKRIQ